MLKVTTQATEVIRELLVSRPEGGLRLAPGETIPEGPSLEIRVAVAPEPAPSDEVLVLEGARVFIDEEIVPILDNRTLDVRPAEKGSVGFRLLRTRQPQIDAEPHP